MVQTLEPRPKYGPPHPPPSGGLPSLPSGTGSLRSVPPGALVSGPPGSPNLSQYPTSMNPYSFQQNPYSTVVRQSSPQLRSATATPEVTIAAGSDSLAANIRGNPDEFGYNRQPVDVAATAPSRQGEKHDPDPTDADSTANDRSTVSQPTNDLDAGGSNRVSVYSQSSDVRPNVVASPSSSTGRRTRGMSRTLKIVNVNDDIPEEESPVKRESSPKSFDRTSSASPLTAVTSPSGSSSSSSPWPTAGEEKQRLYEIAKAKAQKVQAIAKAGGEGKSQVKKYVYRRPLINKICMIDSFSTTIQWPCVTPSPGVSYICRPKRWRATKDNISNSFPNTMAHCRGREAETI